MTELSSESVHGSCVAINGEAVLIEGPSGSGKSDLALRLIDRGAILVSDDYTFVQRHKGALQASAPATIKGQMEVRGLGIVPFNSIDSAPLALIVSISNQPDRLPLEVRHRRLCGMEVPLIQLPALEPSAPIKVELALKHRSEP
ncbi:HPr kinase/phosphatase C-terminal domain-containing protein [Stakelama sediminis]